MFELLPYHECWLAPLAALRDPAPSPQQIAILRDELTDPLRGHGTQARVLLEQGQPIGVLAWVTASIAYNGEMYGGPFIAAQPRAAERLVAELARQAKTAGARYLHVSAWPEETAKQAALQAHGYTRHFRFLMLEAECQTIAAAPFPAGWRRIATEEIDWPRFAALYNRCFDKVPHAPPVSADSLSQEWREDDADAAQLWADADGQYRAFFDVEPDGYIGGVGVDACCAGRGIASAMYALAALSLSRKGVEQLETMVADGNAASLALHRKLGFRETAWRQVWRKTLRP